MQIYFFVSVEIVTFNCSFRAITLGDVIRVSAPVDTTEHVVLLWPPAVSNHAIVADEKEQKGGSSHCALTAQAATILLTHQIGAVSMFHLDYFPRINIY